jgi:hypothetical protein
MRFPGFWTDVFSLFMQPSLFASYHQANGAAVLPHVPQGTIFMGSARRLRVVQNKKNHQ